MTQELIKAIKKAKKLLRLTESENYNEAFTAQKQLNKLKDKHDLSDEMIEPIFTKSVVSYTEEDILYSYDELMYFKIGELFGNNVHSEYNDSFEIKYKGNKTTIKKSLKTIEFINTYVDDYYKNIDTDDMNSVKLGIVTVIINDLQDEVETPELVIDEKAEQEPINNHNIIEQSDMDEEVEETKTPNRPNVNYKLVDSIKSQVTEHFLIGIKHFVRYL